MQAEVARLAGPFKDNELKADAGLGRVSLVLAKRAILADRHTIRRYLRFFQSTPASQRPVQGAHSSN